MRQFGIIQWMDIRDKMFGIIQFCFIQFGIIQWMKVRDKMRQTGIIQWMKFRDTSKVKCKGRFHS